jgi:hypothetical protein
MNERDENHTEFSTVRKTARLPKVQVFGVYGQTFERE